MTIKGLLFDKDGTLLDYAATWMPANRATALAAARGDEALAEGLLRLGGYDAQSGRVVANSPLAAWSNREIAALWHVQLEGWELDELDACINRIFTETGRESAVPVTDLAALFGRLKGRGLKLGVASSDSRAGIEATLARFGVLELLDFAAGYDSGYGLKPDPGMVRAFCAETGLALAEVAVLGDNLHDLEMGHRAGVGLVVGILSGTGDRAELAALADELLDSVDGLEDLLERL
jgi:phosphoglycolate phosphatase